jgi:hypothetical protein
MGKTQTAKEPNKLYDGLSQTAQDTFDAISSYGFRPDKNDAGDWVALETQGDRVVGPVQMLSTLLGEVQRLVTGVSSLDEIEDAAIDTEIELEEDPSSPGKRYLPGTGPIVDQQLADAAGKYHALNRGWKDAGKLRKDAKTELGAICGLKKHLFKPDPDNTNSLIYRAGGLTIRLGEEKKETLEVEIEDAE